MSIARPLAELVELQRGTTYKSALLGLPGPVLLGLASIAREGGFRSDSLRTYGGESTDKLLLRPGDLYVSLKDVTQSGDLLGSVARVPLHVDVGRITQDTVKLVIRSESVRAAFLYWVLRTPEYRAYCRTRAIGTTNLSLSREDFLAFEVPQPTHNRLRLVELLDAIEAKIELNRRMNETLEEMARALFKSWFVDFDRHRGDRDNDSGLPREWAWTNLEQITSKIGSGSTPRGGDRAYVNQGTHLIRSQNVYDENFVWDGLVYIDDEEAHRMRGVTVEPGDVLLNITGASILRTCIVDPDVLPSRVNQHVAIVRPLAGVPSAFVHQQLLRPETKAYLMGMDAGASRQAVTKAHIESVRIPRPPEAVLREFDDVTRPILDRAVVSTRESRTLAELRDLLLSKLLSGDLRIRDAECAVEAVA